MVLLKRLTLIPAVAAALFMAGCVEPHRDPPSVDPNTLGDVEFQSYLADAPLVTVDEAFRAILILADGEDTCKTFVERRDKLESRGIARPGWKLNPEAIIDRGTLAYMVCKICKIYGGVDLLVFGNLGIGDRRYSMRELIYEKIMDEGSAYWYVRGDEISSVLAKADEFMRKTKVYESTVNELPPEPPPGQSPDWVVNPPTSQPETQPPESQQDQPQSDQPAEQPAAAPDAPASQPADDAGVSIESAPG